MVGRDGRLSGPELSDGLIRGPVSYTHLDVYKRQKQDWADVKRVEIWPKDLERLYTCLLYTSRCV